MILKTKRLILRSPRKSDWKDILEGASDIEVSKYLLLVPHPYKKKDALSWVKLPTASCGASKKIN